MRPWVCFALAAISAGGDGRAVSAHDAYIWQRVWTPELREAMQASAPLVQRWRVLAAEVERSGEVVRPRADLAALRGGPPVVMVVRVNGVLPEALPRWISGWAAEWRSAGVPLAGLELDHDCPTARLSACAAMLQRVRQPGLPLAITALPAWLGSRELTPVLAAVDESVLQLHSVMDARRGLFDAAQARRWVRAWSAVSPRPFRIALPAYGSRVAWSGEGVVAAVESETPRAASMAETSRELFVSPRQMREFLTSLGQPRGLAGVSWFRLPTDADSRAWSIAAWHAVLRNETAAGPPRFAVETGGHDIYLRNAGALDAPLPARLVVRGACSGGDGLRHYVYSGNAFVRAEEKLLRPGERLAIGWLRCEGDPNVLAD